MKKLTREEMDYFLGKINFGASALDARSINIMNRIDTLFKDTNNLNEIEEQNENLAYENRCFGEFLDRLGYSFNDISAVATGDFKSMRNDYTATKILNGISPDEEHKFKALNLYDARHWVINHLDCSYEWNINLTGVSK